MADMNELVRLAIDAYHGSPKKYSVDESMDTIRQGLVAANNGSTVLDYKAMRDGKCSGVFAFMEEVLPRIIHEGLTGDEIWNKVVEYRNVNLGDKNIFVIEDSDLFTVSNIADGTQGIRRQRLGGRSEVSINTSLKGVKIYEEMNRVLAGQVDFNSMIKSISESFRRALLDEIYALWNAATADDFGGATYFPAAGSYDEETLLNLIDHVEAVSGGKKAQIITTKKTARHMAPSIHGSDSQSDLYNMGYFGNFYGTPVIVTPQRHKVGSTEFIFPDNELTIIAGDDKMIKCVKEGQPTIIVGDPLKNADLTHEYMYTDRYGLGIVTAGNSGIGKYKFTV